MTSTRRAALAGGVLYLITFASSIPAALMLGPVLTDPGYIVGPGVDGQVILAAALDMVNALACIGTAVALYPVIKRQDESLALGFVTTRMLEAAIIAIGVVCILAVVTLRQEGPTGTDAGALVAVGRGLVAVRDWTFLLGPSLMPALNAVLLGWLLYTSRLVPRIIPTLGLIGAPLLLSSTIGTMFGINDQVSIWTGLATLPIFLWELSLGLWLTFKGFDPSAPILAHPGDAAGGGPSPD